MACLLCGRGRRGRPTTYLHVRQARSSLRPHAHALPQAFMSLDLGYLDPKGPPDVFYAFSELFDRTTKIAERPHTAL